jgi:hypothetical protein
MRKILIAAACATLALGGLQAKHGDDDECRHDRQYRDHRHGDDRDDERYEHRNHGRGEGLPPGLEGYSRGYYGGHVIVYNPHTSIIVDVFAGISIGR